MRQYLDLIERILSDGEDREDRTGTGTRALFAETLRFDLADGFPLLAAKRTPFKAIVAELLWFLSGSSNAKALEDQGVTIWREWGDPVTREMGRIYGVQWRRWNDGDGGLDQIAGVIEAIKTNPTSRRHLVTAWNPGELAGVALPPCHYAFQFYVTGSGRLNLLWHMRSTDTFLGLPFNVASYALLCTMVAHVTGLKPGEIVCTMGDCHLYNNHVAQALDMLSRPPRPLPKLRMIAPPMSIDHFETGNFMLTDYDPHPAIKAPVAV